MVRGLDLAGFDPDSCQAAAVAFQVQVAESEKEIPFHQHRKGQLILALHGGITCEVAQAMWMVPTQHAVWVPGAIPHSNRATINARLCFLFIEPGAVVMPAQCCTLKISPLVRELILRLAATPHENLTQATTRRLVQVLFDELPRQPVDQLQMPISAHPKIRFIAGQMTQHPEDKRTLAQWAGQVAMSERNLARLVVKETGLNFRRWRQQLQLILALRLLISGATVQSTAQALGYDSTTAFITMFKKASGNTPGRYLNTLAADRFTC